jgi:hypothetical protein
MCSPHCLHIRSFFDAHAHAYLSPAVRRQGLLRAREALSGCAYSWELQQLQAQGLLECRAGADDIPCETTCAPGVAASLFFPGFVVLTNYIIMQLIVAVMLEYLKDPVRKAAESVLSVRTRSNRLLPLSILKLSARRWKYKASLRPTVLQLLKHRRLVTHQRYLAAQQQREQIVGRLRSRQYQLRSPPPPPLPLSAPTSTSRLRRLRPQAHARARGGGGAGGMHAATLDASRMPAKLIVAGAGGLGVTETDRGSRGGGGENAPTPAVQDILEMPKMETEIKAGARGHGASMEYSCS